MYILGFVAFAGAAARVPNAGQLKGSANLASGKFVDEAAVKDEVNAGVSSFALKAPGTAPAAAAAAAKGKKGAMDQPVAVQIDETVLKKLQKQLSPKCGERYTAMLKGQGPQMHNFNRHGGDDETLTQCEQELEGKVCHTDAKITESQNAPDGRKLSQELNVEGKSCLPKECTQQSDLQALASFMHGQTKELMPGEAVKVQLNVDCAKSGGGNVQVSGAEPEKQQAKTPKSSSFMTTPLFALALVLLSRF